MKPKIRKVFPANMPPGSARPFCLADPFGIQKENFEVSSEELALIRLMNGSRTCAQIAKDHRAVHGSDATAAEVEKLAGRLAEKLLLDCPGFRDAYAECETLFRAEPLRMIRHAGEGYPADPAEFRKGLSLWIAQAEADGSMARRRAGRVTGIFAPHIDIPLAGPSYAAAFKPAVDDKANELFVIIGTAHYRDVNPFIATTKDFETPFGKLETDRAFVEDLSREYGADLFRDELIQKVEHSVEFQAVFLKSLLDAGSLRKVRIVPLLVSAFAGLVGEDKRPDDVPVVSDFVAALDRTLATRGDSVCIVAGVDMSHVGLKFGHDEAPDLQALHDLEEADRKSLSFACRRDADGFWDDVMADGNARNVCGVAPIWVSSKVMPESEGAVVSWGTDFQPEQGYAVTFAGVRFER